MYSEDNKSKPIWQFTIGEFEAHLKRMVSTLIEQSVKKAFEERASLVTDSSSDTFDIKKASELTGLSQSTIYSKVSRFQMPSLTRGRPLLFSKKELMTWLASGRPKNYFKK
jgi:excisionase family DNA binding protein